MHSENFRKVTKDRLGVFVRLTQKEHERLLNESMLLSWSIPRLLRESYFKRLPMKLTFDKEGESKFLSEYRRIGNNINQLARAANSGDLVSSTDLQSINEQLSVLYRFVMRLDGGR